MAENSPIGKLILLVLRNGSIGSAALMALFIGINVWQHITPEGHLMIEGGDRGFLGLLIVLLLFSLYLVWSIGKELKKPGA